MAPSSLKKMSGSGAMKEGNYASSKESASFDVFTSDDLGLTLLPGPQTQKKDEVEKVQAAIGRDIKICATEQQEDGQSRRLELDDRWQPAERRSTVDEPIGGSCYFGLSKGVERYSSTGSHNDDAVVRLSENSSAIQGKHDLKRNDFSLSTETLSKDIGDGHYHDRDPIPKHSGANHASFLAKEGREAERDLLFNSSNQIFQEEVRIIGLNEAKDSLDSVFGNRHDSGRTSDTTACENSLIYEFCGSKGKKSENLLRTSSSVNLGITFTKPTDNTLRTSYHLNCSQDPAEWAHHSARSPESQFAFSVIAERNNHSHTASALLAPVELQGSSKATAAAHQQALNSLQLSPQQILKQPPASRNLHAAPPKQVSKPVKQLKRSWTRHFPTGSKHLPSSSDQVHTSSATSVFSIGSGTHSNSLKTYFACEYRCNLLAHPNPRTLATSPPIHTNIFSRASYGLERHTFDNRSDTAIVQSGLKAGIKRSNSLPELCLPYQSLIMDQQHGYPGYHFPQFPTPPTEPDVLDDNSQHPGSNQALMPLNQEAPSVLGEIPDDINRPLTGFPYQDMQGNFTQTSQSLANPDMGAPSQGYPPIHLQVHGSDNPTPIGYPVSTNDSFTAPNDERLYTEANYMALRQRCTDQSQRLENYMGTLDLMRERDRISQAKIKEQERTIVVLRQKSETTKTAKPPKEGVKIKSSGKGSVARTIDYARRAHAVAGQQNANARSASVPAIAMGLPSTQVPQVQAPYSEFIQPQTQYLHGLYNPAYPLNPGFLPYTNSSGQYFYPGSLPEDPFQNQENQFQQGPAHYPGENYQQPPQFQQGPAQYSAENYQQPPQFPVSHALPAVAQAEASTAGIKRKRAVEPDAAQAVKRQQQPVVSQTGVSPQEEAADDDHASSEARRKMSQKKLDWLEGFHPYQHVSKERPQQFGIPSAALPQASPLPALAAQAPMGLIAPTPGKASKKTTQETPNKRNGPKSADERKAERVQYNKTYREKIKEKKRLERMQAAENLGASDTTSTPSNADYDDDDIQSLFEEEKNDGKDHISISDDDDLFTGSSIPMETIAHDAPLSSYFNNASDLFTGSAIAQETPEHDATLASYFNNAANPENPFDLSPEDLAFAIEVENELMMQPDIPTDQAVEDATEETIQSIMEVVEEKEEVESEAE